MNVSPARIAAFRVLQRIEKDRAFSSVLLPEAEQALSAKDRGLCHELVLGTLRKQIYLDRLIGLLAGGKRLDLPVRIACRIGLYQLCFLDRIPQHSAVHESVNLVQIARKTSAKGFVNAILRKAAAGPPELDLNDDLDRASVETSHPRWLIERWSGQFGPQAAIEIAAANNQTPNPSFRLLGDTEPPPGSVPSLYVPGCYLLKSSAHEAGDLFRSADIYFQDEASQMVAAALPTPRCFLDVCAAPGGKTGFVVSHHRPMIAVAGDLHYQRVRTLRENLIRQNVRGVSTIQHDAAGQLPFATESFDVVLVDAPCTGTGTIRHNPEIRYFLKPEDPAELSVKQLSIITNASKTVVSGGSLIYSTCSLEREENEDVVDRFLLENSGFEKQKPLVHERFITEDGFGRTFPHRDEMDGFFIAHLRRV
jgi:16S rRNA (cytosine967-C5)-methyltransferase